MLRSGRHLWRLIGIGRCLARHNALFPLELLPLPELVLRVARRLSRQDAPGRPGQRLARALQALGPSFIKLGQSLATRADLLGQELAADLSQLQDDLPPFDGALARQLIERELGRPLAELFASVDSARSPRPRSRRSISASPARARRSRSRCCGPASSARCCATSTSSPGSRPGSSACSRATAASSRSRWSRPSRSGPGSRWTCAWRPRPPPSSPRTSPPTRASGCRGSTGSGPRAAC